MPVLDLRFTNVGPFDNIAFEFDEHINVLVGPNNCGKSAALMVLGDVAVFPFEIPRKLLRGAQAEFTMHVVQKSSMKKELSGPLPYMFGSAEVEVLKEMGYTSFIPALRQSTDFRSKGPIIQKQQNKSEELPAELAKREALLQTNASLIRDDAVIESIIELDYRAYRRNDPAIRKIIDKVAAIASEITEGFPIEFLRVAEDEDGLFPQFRTRDGDVPLNVLSQGTQSIIQWLAFLLIGYAKYYEYASNLEDRPGVLIIDEIDAHLHPSWQRRIIPTLRRHFPNLQLFCSTHSPLMLAGLKAGQVQLLKRDDHGKVTVSRNETDIVGWSADEILRSFLDVPSPTDLQTAVHIERLQELRRTGKLSAKEAAELECLRQTVNQELLGGPIASQMEQLASLLERTGTQSSAERKSKPLRKSEKTKPQGKTSPASPFHRPSR